MDDRQYSMLRWATAVIGAVQLGVAALLSGAISPVLVPVTAAYIGGEPGSAAAPLEVTIARVDVASGSLVVLAVTGVADILLALPRVSARYRESLGVGRTSLRWLLFSLVGPVLVFLVAQVNGIRDISALVTIYALATAGVLFGALQDRVTRTGHAALRPFIFGCMVGIVPWGVIAFYVIAPGAPGASDQPGWVTAATLGLLGLFFAVAAVLWVSQRAGSPGPASSVQPGRADARRTVPLEWAYLVLTTAATLLVPLLLAARAG